MVSVLTLSAVDHVFENWSGRTKDFKFGISCFCDMDYISTSEYLLEIERWRYKNIKREEEGIC
jgi:hypothetical protein